MENRTKLDIYVDGEKVSSIDPKNFVDFQPTVCDMDYPSSKKTFVSNQYEAIFYMRRKNKYYFKNSTYKWTFESDQECGLKKGDKVTITKQ
jgi:hypothetical protein